MDFRLARHTNNLNSIIEFYTNVLGFEILGQFENHENYDGVFLGKHGLDWHLEFTTSSDKAEHTNGEDDALVFYPKTKTAYGVILSNIQKFKLVKLQSKNPYWNRNGIMIKDPDGFYVIVSYLRIK